MAGVESQADEFKRTVREMEQAQREEGMALLQQAIQEQAAAGGKARQERVTAIEDGTGSAVAARVSGDNNLGVESRYGRVTVATGAVDVGTSSTSVVTSTAGRLGLTLQNLDDVNAVHFRLGGGTATVADDLRLGPHESYSLPPGVAFEGAVTAIADPEGARLAWVEYKVAT
jgi:hypothetical protein